MSAPSAGSILGYGVWSATNGEIVNYIGPPPDGTQSKTWTVNSWNGWITQDFGNPAFPQLFDLKFNPFETYVLRPNKNVRMEIGIITAENDGGWHQWSKAFDLTANIDNEITVDLRESGLNLETIRRLYLYFQDNDGEFILVIAQQSCAGIGTPTDGDGSGDGGGELPTDDTEPNPMNASDQLKRGGNKIINQNGKVIVLKGYETGTYIGNGNGFWFGPTGQKFPDWGWNTAYVDEELSNIRAWGFNCFRIQFALENWINDIENFRSHIRYTVRKAASLGIYCILVPYSVIYSRGGEQVYNVTPYPPFTEQGTLPPADMIALIPSIQAFIDIYKEFCIYFKDDPNVIFSMQNEPHDINWETFWSVLNQVMVNARESGVNHLWVQQGDYNSLAPIVPQITESNFALETHHYPYYMYAYGTFNWDSSIEAIRSRLRPITDLASVYPVIIGEIGCNVDNTNTDEQGNNTELTTLRNVLQIFQENGISWIAHWYRPVYQFRFVNTDATPNDAGVIYREFLNKPSGGTQHECAIFEATNGTSFMPYLEILRLFRDRSLNRGLINLYYEISTYIAPTIRRLRGVFRW